MATDEENGGFHLCGERGMLMRNSHLSQARTGTQNRFAMVLAVRKCFAQTGRIYVVKSAQVSKHESVSV